VHGGGCSKDEDEDGDIVRKKDKKGGKGGKRICPCCVARALERRDGQITAWKVGEGGKSLGREAAESEDEMGQAMWIDVGIGTGVADMMTESCGGRRILSDRSNVKQIGSGWRSITEDGIGDHRRWD
jgi:hypothetical protein